ncbi:MAG: dephospho-CoA kinase [Epulopiscium sp.]|nr:dephospho-CoA kinase [Candidatus Epulonipiscium sp.]
MKVVGITGGSGTGKSAIASYFEEKYQAYRIDADKIGHQVIKKGMPAYDLIIKNFGSTILDEVGEINRKILGSIVFSDEKKLKLLNSITHPLIISMINHEIEKCILQNQQYSFILIDGALLIETKIYENIDELWVVYVHLEQRIQRLKKRDNLSRKQILQRIEKQMSWEILQQYADRIIDNSGEFIETIIQCDKIAKEFLHF